MAIQKLDGVKIDGRNQAFGGYIYNVDVQIGLGNTPTKITVNFISKSGDYIEPKLSATAPYKITIGNILSSSFYAISWKKVKSSAGRLLVVNFWDGSVVLDRLWVGLHKKMGDKSTNKISNLILVGEERHPCDINQNGVFDEEDKSTLAYDINDNCELLCPGDQNPRDAIINDCNDKETFELFEVDYTFEDLIAAVKGKVPIGKYPQSNEFYHAKYTGKLREVLSSWCADFGWTFYWEDGVLNFIDTSVRPKINFDSLGCLQSETQEKTIEGTISRGLITHYGQKGIFSQKSCDYYRQIALSCLNLRDLYGNYYFPTLQNTFSNSETSDFTPAANSTPQPSKSLYFDSLQPNGVPIEAFEISCAMAYYGQDLRNFYNFYYYYGFKSEQAAKEVEGYTLDRYGKMKVLKVFANEPAYASIRGDLTKMFFKQDSKESKDFNKKNGFFMLVKIDLDELNKQYEQEQYLAKEFIGQHWYCAYQDVYYGPNPQVVGGGQYYGSLSVSSNDIPFAKFGATPGSKVDNLFTTLSKKQKSKFRDYTSANGDSSSKVLVKSLVYCKKNPIWNPLNGVPNELSAILDANPLAIPRTIDATSFVNDSLQKNTLDKFNIAQTDVASGGFYFISVCPVDVSVSTNTENNPYEESPTYSLQSSNGLFGEVQQGLMAKTCVSLSVNGAKIFTPAGAFSRIDNSPNFSWMNATITEGKPQYAVLISTTTSGAGVIPKMESTLTTDASPSETSMSVEYTVKELDKKTMRYIAKLTPTCRFDKELLEAQHKELHDKTVFNVSEPFESRKYSIFGVTIPNAIKIKDGLEDIQVRIDDKGVVTDIGIGNSKFTPPSQDFLLRKLEVLQSTQIQNSQPNPI